MTRFIKYVIAAVLLFSLVSCSKITAENYQKISVGMEYDEIIKLLGEPNECTVLLNAKTCTWGDEKKNIEVQFIADKVMLYSGVGVL